MLVDERFGGQIDDLAAARSATSIPLLAKGFFTSEHELAELRRAGADGALLILRDLDDGRARALIDAAAACGLDTLVEAHDAGELDRATALGADPIGVNARDLATFHIDRAAQLDLVARAPRDRVVVAESGISTRAQGAAAELAGADAILVGSALMRAEDPAAELAELISRPLVKVCGLTRQADVDVAVAAGADLCGFIFADTPRRAPRVLDVPKVPCRSRSMSARPASTPQRPISPRCTSAPPARSGGATACSCATATRSRASSICPGRTTIPSTTSARPRPSRPDV